MSQSTLVVEVKEKKIFDPDLIKIKTNEGQQKLIEFMIGDDVILSYQGRLCVPHID